MIGGVRPVISTLGHKPVVDGHHQCGIFGCVSNLCAIRQRQILDIDLPGPGFKLGQPRHGLAMNFGWVRKIAALKLCRLFLEVGLNEGDLRVICRVFRPDALQAAVVQGLEECGLAVGREPGAQAGAA